MKILKNIYYFALCTLLFASTAVADDLSTAKQQGLVGETPAGYIAAVQSPSPQTQQLIGRINAERKSKYEQIAQSNGTPVGAVEGLAGKKAIEMTPPGQFVQEGGSWKKK